MIKAPAKRVYIETTIPGAYLERRAGVFQQAQRKWTRLWWDHERAGYELVTSIAVIAELSDPVYPLGGESIALLEAVPKLPIGEEIRAVVKAYIAARMMPRDPQGDALHLALASFYRCDYLLTWNCQHLANPNKFAHLRLINQSLDLVTPQLVTPQQLLPDTYE